MEIVDPFRAGMLDDKPEKLGRALGAPNREGSRLFGRPMPEGEEEAGSPGGPRIFALRAGDAEPVIFDAGDAGLIVPAGDDDRASLDTPATEGLVERGIPPILELTAGEPGRAMPDCKRVTWDGGAGAPLACGALGPVTRRRRSSSCVLSLDDNGPTNFHTCSPTREYPSL